MAIRTYSLLGGRQISTPWQLFVLCVAVLLPVIVFAGFLAYRYADVEREQAYGEVLDSARQIANVLDRDLGGRISTLQVLALSRSLSPENYSGFYSTAEEARRILGTDLAYRTADGRELLNTAHGAVRTPIPVALFASEERAMADNRPVLSDLVMPEDGADPFVVLSVPVERNGTVSGVLSTQIRPQRLVTLLVQARLPDSWAAAVVDSNNVLIARMPDASRYIGTPASDEMRLYGTGLLGTFQGKMVDGRHALSAYARSVLSPWRVAVGIPMAQVEGPINQTLTWFAALASLGLIISTAVAVFFGGAIAGSMRRLTRLASDPSNADRHPPVTTPIREVNAVSTALTDAARDLRRQSEARDRAEQALAASKSRLERILANAPIGIMEFGKDAVTYANDTARELLDITVEGDSYKSPDWELRSGLGEVLTQTNNPVAMAMQGLVIRGAQVHVSRPDVPARVLSVNASPITEDGVITGALATFFDITEQHEADEELRDQRQHLQTLNETGVAIASTLDLQELVQSVVDAGVELTGAAHGAFFYNATDDKGEIYRLYAVSGARREDFDALPMPRITSVFASTFAGTDTVRADDITADPRYGANAPFKGMPPGHLPVRSYLAVPVVSRSGETIGAMLFGHPEPGKFSDKHESLLVGIAAQAAIGIDNARLYEAAQKAEAILREFNTSLEEQVTERTVELWDANVRLVEESAQREEVEDQLRQSLKMEAVGQLTGGLAHDFNNLLAIIIGSLDVLGRRIEKGRTDDLRRFVDAAMEGANRATNLTQRLLAFARRQPLMPQAINANKLVADMSELLRRTISEAIKIETVLGAGLWLTHTDRNQLENALVNLAVNARDAMPEGGQLTIETANFDIDARYAADHQGVVPGQYVLIAVTDTGTGMPPEVIARAFDPFFTTKETGKGTGLGLSQIYGFVRQSGGHIKIYSEVGHGTTIKMYLPRHFGEAQAPETIVRSKVKDGGGRLVLIVEDEDAVRRTSCEALQELGYRCIAASGATEALALLDEHEDVEILFTDIVMPEVNGRKLAEMALARRPDLKVLFTSGYTRNAIVHNGVLEPGVHLIVKPFTIDQLAAKLAEVVG